MTITLIPINNINPIIKRILNNSSYIGALILASAGSKLTLKPIQNDIPIMAVINNIKE